MNKYVWYVITRCVDGKFHAIAIRLRMNENLVMFIKDYPNIHTMNPCETKTAAQEIANAWNESFKANGTYMFGNVTF